MRPKKKCSIAMVAIAMVKRGTETGAEMASCELRKRILTTKSFCGLDSISGRILNTRLFQRVRSFRIIDVCEATMIEQRRRFFVQRLLAHVQLEVVFSLHRGR